MGKPQATVITSSPGFNLLLFNLGEVSDESAKRFAEEPEFTSIQYFKPKNLAKSSSNCLAYLPAVSQKSSEASTRLVISFSS